MSLFFSVVHILVMNHRGVGSISNGDVIFSSEAIDMLPGVVENCCACKKKSEKVFIISRGFFVKSAKCEAALVQSEDKEQ